MELTSPRPAAAPRPRILLADDESRIRLVLRACLEAEGYEVFEAADGLEALDSIIHAAPDLMILDLAMPTGAPCWHMKPRDQRTKSARNCEGGHYAVWPKEDPHR